jgi:hypothetical protein
VSLVGAGGGGRVGDGDGGAGGGGGGSILYETVPQSISILPASAMTCDVYTPVSSAMIVKTVQASAFTFGVTAETIEKLLTGEKALVQRHALPSHGEPIVADREDPLILVADFGNSSTSGLALITRTFLRRPYSSHHACSTLIISDPRQFACISMYAEALMESARSLRNIA